MDALTWVNAIVLGILVLIGWLKLANGDESQSCCAVILGLLAVGCAVLGVIIYGAGALFGWW